MDFKDIDLKSVLHIIIKNPIRKIFAIIFAFGLWSFVALDKNYVYRKDIKITYTNLADSFMIVESVPTINVSFIGRGGSLLSTWAAPPKARCDIADREIGTNTIPTSEFLIPTGFPDLKWTFNTPSIAVTIDKRITKIIRVTVPFKGALKQDYSISEVVVLDTVSVTGPRNILLDQKEVLTETLDIKNKRSSFLAKLRIAEMSELFEFSRENVQVEIKIDTTIEKLFTNIPLTLLFTPEQRVSSEKISLDTLIVQGPSNRMHGLEKKDITVKITLTKLPVGEHYLPATIVLPQYFKPVNSVPKKFKISIY